MGSRVPHRTSSLVTPRPTITSHVKLRGFYAWLDENRLDVAQFTWQDITRRFQSMHAERLAPVTRHGILIEIHVNLRC